MTNRSVTTHVTITVRGMTADRKLVHYAQTRGTTVAEWANAPCCVLLHRERRFDGSVCHEATVSLRIGGAPIWVVGSAADPHSALAMAFDRIGPRTMQALLAGNPPGVAA